MITTLDQIPGLTDEDHDRLFAELDGQIKPPPTKDEWLASIRGDNNPRAHELRCMADDWHRSGEVIIWPRDPEAKADLCVKIEHNLRAQRRYRRVCHPDCPASVLESLPGLVERWTGRSVDLSMWMEHCYDGNGPANINVFAVMTVVDERRLEPGTHVALQCAVFPARHLPHACFCAAWAACVVLGRKG